MGEFFNLDNKFFQTLSKMVDCVSISVVWMFCCIPIFTAGAATTALYYTINKSVRNGRGYVWKEYWSAFRSNFKQSTIVWLILLVVYAILTMDGYIMYQFSKAGEKYGALYLAFIVIGIFVSMWAIYLFPYIARFSNTTKVVMKNAAFISIGNLLWTILLFIILLAAILGVYIIPIAIVFVPAVYMLLTNLVLERIFKRYMSEEDLAAEEERNRDFYN